MSGQRVQSEDAKFWQDLQNLSGDLDHLMQRMPDQHVSILWCRIPRLLVWQEVRLQEQSGRALPSEHHATVCKMQGTGILAGNTAVSFENSDSRKCFWNSPLQVIDQGLVNSQS